jgi:hypothetical protein
MIELSNGVVLFTEPAVNLMLFQKLFCMVLMMIFLVFVIKRCQICDMSILHTCKLLIWN